MHFPLDAAKLSAFVALAATSWSRKANEVLQCSKNDYQTVALLLSNIMAILFLRRNLSNNNFNRIQDNFVK